MAVDQDICSKYPWINVEFFEQILNKDEKIVKVIKFDLLPALNNGENYSSFLIKAVVQYGVDGNNHTKTLIIKATLGEQLVRSCNVFSKEICIYETIAPQIENALKMANIPFKLTPM